MTAKKSNNFYSSEDNQKYTISFNDIQKGYNTFDTVQNVYKEIITKLKPELITRSKENESFVFLTYPNYRGGNYNWRIFKKDDSIIMMEFYGRWEGYAHESREPPEIDDEKAAGYKLARITVIPPTDSIQKLIEKIICDYKDADTEKE